MNRGQRLKRFGLVVLLAIIGAYAFWSTHGRMQRSTLCVSFRYPSFYESEALSHQLAFDLGKELKNSKGNAFPFFEIEGEQERVDQKLVRGNDDEEVSSLKREAIKVGWSPFQLYLTSIYTGIRTGSYNVDVYLSGHRKPFMAKQFAVGRVPKFGLIDLPKIRSIQFQIANWSAIQEELTKSGKVWVVCEFLDGSGNFAETSEVNVEHGQFRFTLLDGTKYRIWVMAKLPASGQRGSGYALTPKSQPASPGLPFGDDVLLVFEKESTLQEMPIFPEF